jgi:hypothetical protein
MTKITYTPRGWLNHDPITDADGNVTTFYI